MALFSRDPHEHWPKQHFSENEVANSGHLANEDAATLLIETNPPCLQTLLLGHISQECNSRSLIRQTFTDALARLGRQDISLSLLDQDAPCDLFEF